jgi:alpha-mannosidase
MSIPSFRLRRKNVVLTAMKKAEDSDGLILHMYEWAGQSGSVELRVPAGATGAMDTNLMEQPRGQQLTVTGDLVTLPIRPSEILALRVDYPSKSTQ